MEITKKDNNISSFSKDIEQNTKMLLEVPGLAEQTCLSVGNAIFIPKGEGDINNKYKVVNITVDDKPVIFVTADSSKPRSVYPTSATAFNIEGVKKIFQHGGIPIEFKQAILMLAKAKEDVDILKIAFEEQEIIGLLTGTIKVIQ